jgi:hypothetical protein
MAMKVWIRYWGLTVFLIVLCTSIIVIWLLLYYSRRKASGRISRKPESQGSGGSPVVEPPTNRPISTTAAHVEVLNGLSPVAGNFNGLYGALRKVASGQVNGRTGYNVIRDWERRIQQTRTAFLNSAWSELVLSTIGTTFVTDQTLSDQSISAVAKGWLDQLTKWGVRADLRSRFCIDEEACARYHFEGDYELGDTAVPELPCWTLGEQVVERGLAEVIRT